MELAKGFVEDLGRRPPSDSDGPAGLDHKPLVEQEEAGGHSVASIFMYIAMADIAALTDAPGYLEALERFWKSIVATRLYLTGGTCARRENNHEHYDLPNQKAVCESCAAMANVLWGYRLFLLHGNAKYVDVLERILYNGVASNVSLDGKGFYYSNTLMHDGGKKGYVGGPGRLPFMESACCPTFAVRFWPLIGGFVYATRADHLYVNLFIAGRGKIRMRNCTVEIEQTTRYPWDGAVKLTITPDRPSTFTLCVRVPGWVQGRPVPSDLYRYLNPSTEPIVLRLNGQAETRETQKGFVSIRRTWSKGDVIELDLPMPIRRVVSHEAVKENTGCVALERGPIVYCVEGCDHDGHVLNLALSDQTELRAEHRPDLLGGVTVIRGSALATHHASDGTIATTRRDLTAIPYCVWANRGVGEMAVWLPRDPRPAMPP